MVIELGIPEAFECAEILRRTSDGLLEFRDDGLRKLRL